MERYRLTRRDKIGLVAYAIVIFVLVLVFKLAAMGVI